YGISKSPLFS
ncbi:unnamed protein product, partial [Callosobruchus maculatus]